MSEHPSLPDTDFVDTNYAVGLLNQTFEMADIDLILDTFSNYRLKVEQRQILKELALCKNVFAVLPTGYGKSVSFGLFGKLMDLVSYNRVSLLQNKYLLCIHFFINYVDLFLTLTSSCTLGKNTMYL